jgi:hypothetical protein
MKRLATLTLALLIGTSVGCCCSHGCGSGYGSYYGGSSCPGGNCGIQGASNAGFNGLQSASIPGAIPMTAAGPVYYNTPMTASAPIIVHQTAEAPLPTYGN